MRAASAHQEDILMSDLETVASTKLADFIFQSLVGDTHLCDCRLPRYIELRSLINVCSRTNTHKVELCLQINPSNIHTLLCPYIQNLVSFVHQGF